MTEDEERKALSVLLPKAVDIWAKTGDDTALKAIVGTMTDAQRNEWLAAGNAFVAQVKAVKASLEAAGPNGLSGYDLYANTKTHFTSFADFTGLMKSMVKRGEVRKPWFKFHYSISP